jgi:hypothetical protein
MSQEAPWRDMRRRRVLEDFDFAKSLLGDDFSSIEGTIEKSFDTYETTSKKFLGVRLGGSTNYLGRTVAPTLDRMGELNLLGRDSVEMNRERQRGALGRESTNTLKTTLNSLLGSR